MEINGIDITKALTAEGQEYVKIYGVLPPPEGHVTAPELADELGCDNTRELVRLIDKLRYEEKIPWRSPDTDLAGHTYGKRHIAMSVIYTQNEVNLIMEALSGT